MTAPSRPTAAATSSGAGVARQVDDGHGPSSPTAAARQTPLSPGPASLPSGMTRRGQAGPAPRQAATVSSAVRTSATKASECRSMER